TARYLRRKRASPLPLRRLSSRLVWPLAPPSWLRLLNYNIAGRWTADARDWSRWGRHGVGVGRCRQELPPCVRSGCPRPRRSSRRYNLAHDAHKRTASGTARRRAKMDEQGLPGEQTEQAATWLDLYDWRRRVARLYAERVAALAAGAHPAAVLER